MQLYFIRHAQSTNNALYARTGQEIGRSHDPELTEVGVLQARRMAEFLCHRHGTVITDQHDTQNRAGFGITHLYSSLMIRAVTTGSILAETLGLPLHGWLDWHEEGGLFLEMEGTGERVGQPGYSRREFDAKYPALRLPDAIGDDGWWNRPFEEPTARTERARRVLAELLERHGHTEDRVAVVSHGGFYNHFLAAVFGLPGPLKVGHLMNNCGISRFAFSREGGAFVLYQNRADFLPAELVTH